MDPTTRALFMSSRSELEPGDPLDGGYFAGYISHTADGNPTHALIVAPASTVSSLQFKTSNTSSPGTSSTYDGAANTANMADVSHPAAYYCDNLNINGYTDWYLPAFHELEIAYYNLKPSTVLNTTTSSVGAPNIYAVPPRFTTYTSTDPSQTSAVDFQSGNTEAFIAASFADYHRTSTEVGNQTQAWIIRFINGTMSLSDKTTTHKVRAFRKVPL